MKVSIQAGEQFTIFNVDATTTVEILKVLISSEVNFLRLFPCKNRSSIVLILREWILETLDRWRYQQKSKFWCFAALPCLKTNKQKRFVRFFFHYLSVLLKTLPRFRLKLSKYHNHQIFTRYEPVAEAS